MKPIERVNYHTHCARCMHAGGSVDEYAAQAAREGLTRLGISDHMPYPDDRFGLRMPYAQIDDYLNDLTRLKEEYAGRLTILSGFEGEYSENERAYYESLLARADCDYLILGQHFYETEQGELVNVFQLSSTQEYELYAANAVEGMRTGYFRYLAHPDLIFINPFAWDVHCERACDRIIDSAVKYGFALEYNANGLRRGVQSFPDGERYPYPIDRFWEKVKNTGIEVYVGSDCHNPRSVYDDTVVYAYEHLADMGITPKLEF